MYTVIMDLDGTLIDSLPDVCASLNRALQSEGLSTLNIEQVRKMVGGGARAMIEHAVRESGGIKPVDADTLCHLFLDEYSARPIENTVIYPGVVDVLNNLKAAGVNLGICTNKPEKTAYPVLQAIGLDEYFPAIACGDTLAYKKPDGRHVHKVIEMLDGDVATTVFVGDSETDIAAARNAGIPVVLVSYGYTLEAPDTLGADMLIDDFRDLPKALEMFI